MERQNRVLREANTVVKKEEKKERRRRRLSKAKNGVLVVAVAVTALAAEYAILNPSQYKAPEPSCAYSPFQIDCTWNPVAPSPTHVSVPEHEIMPNLNKRIR